MTLTLDIISFSRPTGDQLVTRISTGPHGEQANSGSFDPRVTADGHYLVFGSYASNLGAPIGANSDIFRKDLRTGQVELVTPGLNGAGSSNGSHFQDISADGRYVTFISQADNLVAGDTGGMTDVFFRDLGAPNSPIIRISEGPNGVEANNFSTIPALIERADGRFLIFQSAARNLVSNDLAGYNDIFLKNLSDPSAPLRRLSTGLNNAEANGESFRPAVSADGRYAVFESSAGNLVAGTTRGVFKVYRINLLTGTIDLVSKAADGSIPASGKSSEARLSGDGRYVIFTSAASDLTAGDINDQADVFRKDLLDGSIERIFTGTHAQGMDRDYNAQISPDGRYVLFQTDASDVVAGDTNTRIDVFRKDMVTGLVERLSVHLPDQANGDSTEASFVGDGHFVVMNSAANNLVAGDSNGYDDIFLVDADRIHDAQAMKDGRVVDLRLGIGAGSSVDVAWGDGTSEIVSASGGVVALSHVYAVKGSKDVVVAVHEGSLTRAVHHALDAANATFGRNTALADTLTGGSGGDVLAGDAFVNVIVGHGGDDTLSGAAGADSLDGGAGNDNLDGGADSDSLNGGAGDDALSGGAGADKLVGEDGNDNLDGGADADHLDGGAGNDALSGALGADELIGQAGNDTLDGGADADHLDGGAGNDTLDGGTGADRMTGGAGDDTYRVDDAADVIIEAAGDGTDTAIVSLDFNMGALANVETIKLADGSVAARVTGGAGDDHLIGNTNFNIIDGAGGADTMEGGAGSDVFLVDNAADLVVEAAGGGMDAVQATVSYALAASAEVEVMTALGSAGLSLTGSDSANTLHGNAGANTLTGQGGNDVLDGGLGADRLNGGLGNDIVHGGAGKDQLWGGAGRDTFVFDTKPNKRTDLDKVSDFSVRDDAIWLDNGVMPKLGRRGSEDRPVKLNKAFFALDTAKDGNDHVIYKKSTGALYYDPDGTGAKAAIQLATLSKNLKIQATDFFVV